MAYAFRDEQPTRHATWGTWLLVGACVFTFAFIQPAPMQGLTHGLTVADNASAELQVRAFEDRWALVPCEITHGRSIAEGAACNGYPTDQPGAWASKNVWVPLFTALFLHGGILHLLGNLLFLWVFGRALEERVGPAGVLGLFLAGGLIAFLGYVAWNPEVSSPVLGASGAIAAIMGACLALDPRRRLLSFVTTAGFQILYLPVWALMAFFFVSQFFTAPSSGVAWQAHVVGVVFGVIVGAAWGRFDPTLRQGGPPPTTDIAVAPIASTAPAVWATSVPTSPPIGSGPSVNDREAVGSGVVYRGSDPASEPAHR
ncbi:MAG: rhomboid family intramembrane serine protease [Actinobacteria bacterium]|nr:rhomboid family intramembrane serine protease [Actinomycetota bacterium]